MTYACRDRLPYAESFPAQDGYNNDGSRRIVMIPFSMSKLCEYAKNDKYNDPKCVGCEHKQPKGAE